MQEAENPSLLNMKHFQKGHMSGYFRSRKIGKLEQNVSKMLTGCQIFGIPQRSVSGKVCEIASRALSLQNMSGFLHVLAGWISKMDFCDGFCYLWLEISQRRSSLSSASSQGHFCLSRTMMFLLKVRSTLMLVTVRGLTNRGEDETRVPK